MKMKEKLKLKKEVKVIIYKAVITLIVIVFDVALYHYLSIIGEFQGTTSWCNAFLVTGWAWLLLGTIPFLSFVYDFIDFCEEN